MWCKHCKDGSPMVASVEDPNLWECIDCGQVVYFDGGSESVPIPFRLNKKERAFAFRYEAPKVEKENHLFRFGEESHDLERWFDGKHEAGVPHFRSTFRKSPRVQQKTKRTPLLFWLSFLLGVVAFTCGGTMIAWSLLNGDNNIWQVGIPIAFAGQAILFVAFVLQMDWLTERTMASSELLQTLRKTSSSTKHSSDLGSEFLRKSTIDA